jgi:serine/threonine protein kinase
MEDAGRHPAGQHPETTKARFTLGKHDPDPRPEVIRNRYEVGRLIGRGATARVFRARDLSEGCEVAIKLFHSDALAAEERRRLKEVQILGSLQHPGLVTLYDAGTEDGLAFLAMQLVEGPTLADRISVGPLTVSEVIELAVRLADALAYVHGHGVTHRDLKPANVILGPDGPLISDFGIAQAFDSTRVTATGTVVGTAAYMAPEQVLGDSVGPSADIYALGLVLLECLTGVREYGGTMVESAVVRLHRPPRIPAGLPFLLEDVLRKMTAQHPEDRPPARAVAEALRVGERTLMLGPVSPPPAARTARRRTLVMAGLPVIAAAITGVAVLGPRAENVSDPAQPMMSAPDSPSTIPSSSAAPPSMAATSFVVAPSPTPAARPAPAGGNAKNKAKKSTDEHGNTDRHGNRQGGGISPLSSHPPAVDES